MQLSTTSPCIFPLSAYAALHYQPMNLPTTSLRICYEMPGTHVAYGATRMAHIDLKLVGAYPPFLLALSLSCIASDFAR
eukprot:621179-Rhodomonas_salina.2